MKPHGPLGTPGESAPDFFPECSTKGLWRGAGERCFKGIRLIAASKTTQQQLHFIDCHWALPWPSSPSSTFYANFATLHGQMTCAPHPAAHRMAPHAASRRLAPNRHDSIAATNTPSLILAVGSVATATALGEGSAPKVTASGVPALHLMRGERGSVPASLRIV